jgi:hypothetical protein
MELAERRRAFLILALRRFRPGRGSSVEFLRERTAVQATPDLAAILGDIRWRLVGGLALRAYAPERMTLDVDILIPFADEDRATLRLTEAGYAVLGPLRFFGATAPAKLGGFSARLGDGPPLDVLTTRADWLLAALDRPPTRDAAGLPVLPRPELLVMKFLSGRPQDLADMGRLGGDAGDLAAARALVAAVAPADLDDFDMALELAALEAAAEEGE